MPTRWISVGTLAALLAFFVVHGEARSSEGGPRPITLVGELTEQHRRVCDADGRERWVEPHFEIGFVRVRPRAGLNLRPLLGRIVVAQGLVVPAPAARPPAASARSTPREVSTGRCPEVQMRSDHVVSKGGLRRMPARTGALENLGEVELTRVGPFAGLRATPMSGKPARVAVTFANALGRPLPSFILTAHYEGCFGKPGSLERAHRTTLLAAGGVAKTRFLAEEQGPSRDGTPETGRYLLSALRLASASSEVVFDLEVPVHRLDVALSCSARRSP